MKSADRYYGTLGEPDYIGSVFSSEEQDRLRVSTKNFAEPLFGRERYVAVVFEEKSLYPYALEGIPWTTRWWEISVVGTVYQRPWSLKVTRIYPTRQRDEHTGLSKAWPGFWTEELFQARRQQKPFSESWSTFGHSLEMRFEDTARKRLASARQEIEVSDSAYIMKRQVLNEIFRYTLDVTSLKISPKRAFMVPPSPVALPRPSKEPLVSKVALEVEPLRNYFETDGLHAIESLEDTLYLPLVKALQGGALSLQSIEEQFDHVITQFEGNVRNPAVAYVMSRLKGVAKFVADLADVENAALAYDREVDRWLRADLSDGDVSRKITARFSANSKPLKQLYARRERIKLALLKQFLAALKSEDHERQLKAFYAFQIFAYVVRVYVNDIEGRKLRDVCDEMEASLLCSKRSREKESRYFA